MQEGDKKESDAQLSAPFIVAGLLGNPGAVILQENSALPHYPLPRFEAAVLTGSSNLTRRFCEHTPKKNSHTR